LTSHLALTPAHSLRATFTRLFKKKGGAKLIHKRRHLFGPLCKLAITVVRNTSHHTCQPAVP
jgi:hypothetical protein